MRTGPATVARTAFLLGVVTGARTMTGPAAVALAVRAGRLPLGGTRLGFFSAPAAVPVLLALAAGEFVVDSLPGVGSRASPPQFAARLASGGLCGAAIGMPHRPTLGLLAGLAGTTAGTLATAAARSALARLLGRDLPAALLEDALVIASAAALLR